MEYRHNGNDVNDLDICKNLINLFDYKMINNLFNNKINNQTIKFIGKGGQGRVYMIQDEKCGTIVMKIIKNNKSIEYENEREMSIYCKKLIDKNICPNFLYIYFTKSIGNYGLIMSEYANGTLEDWLKLKHTYEEWRSFLFQYLMGIYCLQYKLKTYHADLKPKNIFYKNLLIDTNFEYVINQKIYNVPTYGYLYMLADFGRAQSLLLKHNKLNANAIKLSIKNNMDLSHIIDLPKRIIVNTLETIYSLDDLLNIIKIRNDKYFKSYYDDKVNEINKNLSKYPEHIKKNMIYRAIAYYIVEKQYIDINELPDNMMKMKLPPEKIIDQIVNFSGKEIEEIINEFTEFTSNNNNANIRFIIN